MTTATKGHNVNTIDQIMAATLNATSTVENQQGKLTMYMFDNEASYDLSTCKSVLAMSGKPRADHICDKLADASPAFAKVLTTLEEIKKDANRKPERETLTKKRKAGIDMFTRALTATFFLRYMAAHDDADQKIEKVHIRTRDNAFQIQLANGDIEFMSNNALVRSGNDTWKKLTGKADSNRVTNATSPEAVAKAQAGMFTTLDATLRRPDLDIEELSDEAGRALNSAFATFVKKSFLHDGEVDARDLAEWIETQLPGTKISHVAGRTTRKTA